jgi:hypothetical protein
VAVFALFNQELTNNNMETTNKMSQESFEIEVNKLHATAPYCYGAIAGAAQQVTKFYAELGIDTKDLEEAMRKRKGRLWNYSGD